MRGGADSREAAAQLKIDRRRIKGHPEVEAAVDLGQADALAGDRLAQANDTGALAI